MMNIDIAYLLLTSVCDSYSECSGGYEEQNCSKSKHISTVLSNLGSLCSVELGNQHEMSVMEGVETALTTLDCLSTACG